MEIINYISSMAIPLVIVIIIIFGLIEKRNVFDDFIDGVKEGIEMVIKLMPTLIGLFVLIGVLRNSGLMDVFIKFLSPLTSYLKIPAEIMPLIMVRPISGSASLSVATEIMKNYGVDSMIGLMASTIMGSTETTLYVLAIYTSGLKIKKKGGVLWIALMADIAGMLFSVGLWRILSKCFY